MEETTTFFYTPSRSDGNKLLGGVECAVFLLEKSDLTTLKKLSYRKASCFGWCNLFIAVSLGRKLSIIGKNRLWESSTDTQ